MEKNFAGGCRGGRLAGHGVAGMKRMVYQVVPVPGRPNVYRPAPAPLHAKPSKPDGGISSAADLLQKENELLKSTLQAVTQGGASSASVEATTAKDEVEEKEESVDDPDVSADDYWSPVVGAGGEFVERYGKLSDPPVHDGTQCIQWDNTLSTHTDHFKYRFGLFKKIRHNIDMNEGGLDKFSQGYKYYGFTRGENDGQKGIWYREWAPGAKALCLLGEFNNWNPDDRHWAIKNEFGVWQLFLPDGPDGTSAIPHRSKIKCRLETCFGEWVERIPAWIKWATQEWHEVQFNGVYYEPPEKGVPGVIEEGKSYTFKYPRPDKPANLRIYECHIGMSSKEAKINSYLEFKDEMLPRIRSLGYNAIQIMAIQEHAYYGSFGYHVTNFFAASSRFGTPDELKALIDEAHRMGIIVLMDIVHSHASKNTMDGLNMFDGSDSMYFHSGGKGYHWMWDSRLFNYGNWETLRFLLSNSRWWLDEYKFDGYRFDGVTSMMYHHHGLQMDFTGNYDQYFGLDCDVDAVVYLQLVNNLLHDLFPNCITVGEDVSGMPTFCRPWHEGGVGFDYRLQMAIADKWIEILGTQDDYSWNMGNIVHTLQNRRYAEDCVAYAESHDQALVGDKTIAFWLMDKDMYDCMSIGANSHVVDRGVALHKMIRLITMALGGEAYLNFMGNEFGHPEWIDFPRDDFTDPSTGKFVPGNGGSLDKCRRRWDLADSEELKYKFMNKFDRAMNHLDKAFGFSNSEHTWVSRKDEGDKVVVAERGELVFVFNFHPEKSYTDYRVGCKAPGDYKIVLSSDEPVFGGYQNASKDNDVTFVAGTMEHDGRPASLQIYAPSRTVVAYAPAKFCDKSADSLPRGIPGLAVKGRGPAYAM